MVEIEVPQHPQFAETKEASRTRTTFCVNTE